MLFVVKILPELLNGKTSKNKLRIAANKNKFSILFSFFNALKFLNKKTINKNAIPIVKMAPTIPKSINIST